METSTIFYPEGQGAQEVRPGDFLLTHGDYPTSRLIRLSQRLRYEERYARWSHVALITSADGDLAEAASTGIVSGHIRDYLGTDYHLVPLQNVSDEDRGQVKKFADNVLHAPYRTEFAWYVVASVMLTLLTNSRFVFGMVGTATCSGFVAEALVRTGIIFEKPPSHMTPADLAMKYLKKDLAA
jgi:hypothetical protein